MVDGWTLCVHVSFLGQFGVEWNRRIVYRADQGKETSLNSAMQYTTNSTSEVPVTSTTVCECAGNA